jgi:hypothetical protein
MTCPVKLGLYSEGTNPWLLYVAQPLEFCVREQIEVDSYIKQVLQP